MTTAEVNTQLTDYFAQLTAAFERAADRCPAKEFSRCLSGHRLTMRCSGEALAALLTRSLNHLEDGAESLASGMEVLAWDSHDSGVGLPPPPWPWPDGSNEVRFVLPHGGEAFRLQVFEGSSLFVLHCLPLQRVACWTPDARSLPTYVHASPLLSPLHWWASGQGLSLVHAGCVGTSKGAVLLAGPGGSGKSTTALLSALAGLDYLSDDYCLVRPSPTPEAICLYSSGKLHRHHLLTFPELARRALDPGPDRYEKPVIFMHEHFPTQIAPQRKLRAVLAPKVSGQRDTCLIPMTPAEALKALAPSTLFQLPSAGGGNLREMAALVRALPCYRLELGTHFEQIPRTIRTLIEEF